MKPRSARQILREKGLRATLQRLAISAVVTQSARHLGVEELYEQVRRRMASISRATVYNTLHTLVERGVVKELKLHESRILYDTNPEPHHHFVCEVTGEVIDIPDKAVGPVRIKRSKKELKVKDYTIVFRGTLARGKQSKEVKS